MPRETVKTEATGTNAAASTPEVTARVDYDGAMGTWQWHGAEHGIVAVTDEMLARFKESPWKFKKAGRDAEKGVTYFQRV